MNTVHHLPAPREQIRYSKATETPLLRLHFTDQAGVHHRASVMTTLRIETASIPPETQAQILAQLSRTLDLAGLTLRGVRKVNTLAMELGEGIHQ